MDEQYYAYRAVVDAIHGIYSIYPEWSKKWVLGLDCSEESIEAMRIDAEQQYKSGIMCELMYMNILNTINMAKIYTWVYGGQHACT